MDTEGARPLSPQIRTERGWCEILPDPDEPLIHVYAEGDTEDVSFELESELRTLVEDVMQGQETEVPAQISS